MPACGTAPADMLAAEVDKRPLNTALSSLFLRDYKSIFFSIRYPVPKNKAIINAK